jgi:hypothetical protein
MKNWLVPRSIIRTKTRIPCKLSVPLEHDIKFNGWKTSITYANKPQWQTSMSPAGFEHKISAGERPQTYDLDGAATGTGQQRHYH